MRRSALIAGLVMAVAVLAGTAPRDAWAANLTYRVAAGSAVAYTDSAGGLWSADCCNTGGSTYSASTAISGTSDPVLYQRERWGSSGFTYTFTGLTAGSSDSVTLKFAEIYWTQVGQRQFNVAINGTSVLSNFDIIKDVGSANRADDKTFAATADAGGNIVIAFSNGASDHPKVSAIEVASSPVGPPANTALPVISGTAQQGQTLSASTGTWANAPTGYAYQWQQCDSSGATCATLSAATASSYAVRAGDIGHTIRVAVTARNSSGSATATSAASPVVAAPHDPLVVAVGDIACAPGDTTNSCDQAPTASLASAQHPDAVLPLGDNQYNSGLLSEYTGVDAYGATWGVFNSIAHPTPGNHEYGASATAAGYFSYFGGAVGASTPAAPYYSYNLGTWHMVSLDSSCSDTACDNVVQGETSSAQTSWLQADLAAHPTACTLAYWHHPRFSASWMNDSPGTGPLFSALYNAHADIVVSGHDHVYERYAPQDPSGAATSSGVRQFVVGTGGESLFTMLTNPTTLQASDANDFGVLVLTLHTSSYDWAFRRLNGTVVDSGTAACHGSGTGTLAARVARGAHAWPVGPTGPALRFDARVQRASLAMAKRGRVAVAIALTRAADITVTVQLRRGRRRTRIASFYETENEMPRARSRILLRLPAAWLKGAGSASVLMRFTAVDAAGHRRTLTRTLALSH